MSAALPALRPDLEIMPSPVAEQPGLLIRDPFQFSEQMIVVPPLLVSTLDLFDGAHTELDLRERLTKATGDLQVGELAKHLVDALEQSGFLESDTFFRLRDQRIQSFRDAPERTPAHAGSAYPQEPEELRAQLEEYGARSSPNGSGGDRLVGIAAPHVSPFGGYRSYAAAYNRLGPEHASKTFLILGTSHYGEPERFGLTGKPYRTPLGLVETDQRIVDRLAKAAPDAVEMEDFNHSTEHSIEFQTVFLQHILSGALPEGEPLRAVPILCGPFIESLLTGRPPESNESLRRFFDALGELVDQQPDDFVFVLGVDMAHIGRRYGDPFEAKAEEGRLLEVRRRDQQRLERIQSGDRAGYFELVRPDQDDLRWCGYSPIYTFLAAAGELAGKTLEYEQWNIDEASVVSFAGMEFLRPEG